MKVSREISRKMKRYRELSEQIAALNEEREALKPALKDYVLMYGERKDSYLFVANTSVKAMLVESNVVTKDGINYAKSLGFHNLIKESIPKRSFIEYVMNDEAEAVEKGYIEVGKTEFKVNPL